MATRRDRPGPAKPHVDMITIPAQEFEMGTDQGEPDEAPPHRVRVARFQIDRVEVTVADYAACVFAGKCAAALTSFSHCNVGKPGMENHPVNCVNYRMATSYCAWRDARLPTEIEWELVARGSDTRVYPWGNELPAGRACWARKPQKLESCNVGTFPSDKSPFGILDLAGNVSEWTSSPFCNYADPKQCRSGVRVIRGGSWDADNPSLARTTYRDWSDDDNYGHNLGFRCAKNAS